MKRERERENFVMRNAIQFPQCSKKKKWMYRARRGEERWVVYCKINETRKRKLPIISLKKGKAVGALLRLFASFLSFSLSLFRLPYGSRACFTFHPVSIYACMCNTIAVEEKGGKKKNEKFQYSPVCNFGV